MWAQRLGHKNTSRVKPPVRNWTQSLTVGPFPRLPLLLARATGRTPPPVVCAPGEKEMQAC